MLRLCSPTAMLHPGQARRDNQMRQSLSIVDVIDGFCCEIECDAKPMLNRLLNNHHPAHVIHTSTLRAWLVERNPNNDRSMLSQTYTGTSLLPNHKVSSVKTAVSSSRTIKQAMLSVKRRLLQSLYERLVFKLGGP